MSGESLNIIGFTGLPIPSDFLAGLNSKKILRLLVLWKNVLVSQKLKDSLVGKFSIMSFESKFLAPQPLLIGPLMRDLSSDMLE